MYYVYILQSKITGELYKGSSDDLKERLKDHNNGKVRSTQHGKPWELIYYEAFINKTDSLREENFLKTGKGRDRIKYLLKNSIK